MIKRKNEKVKTRDKKNLSIVNRGDTVTIRNKSMIAGAIAGFMLLAFLIVLMFMFREAWDVPAFWFVFVFIFVSTLFSFINRIFGKVIIDSRETTMIVYNPFRIEYKFEDINYIDEKSSKPSGGVITHSVIVYIGKGRRRVVIETTSRKQADTLITLLRGMLDNGAMEYPEGNEGTFEFDKTENVLAPAIDGCSRFFDKIGGKIKRTSKKKDAIDADFEK